ncbi:transcriptional regulator, MarR family [Methylobacterium sp. 4-46]|uniref:MarR family winged helix-turn-helix transcriptional regulator n=1 Tax=unclassified Methylobacterium TaxID=2615210 RepID=UPI000152C6F5|nr:MULTISPECIES: MarR family transcriptional regulator [Methylobacterium]ACA18605.1 transcriptional regulator, MarR family [Methylobacterium sp. 4-46]WFT77886.1 MarR family transcriptional regulator [Methylobacterium nodulans]
MSGSPAEVAATRGAPATGDLHLAQQICFAVYSAAHAFNRIYKPLLDGLGLTYPQYLALLVLWEEDGQTMKAIGQRLYLDSGTLTPLMKRLEAGGLVKRARDGADERLMRITLTEAGRALRQKALPFPHEIVCATGRTPAHLEALRDEIVALRDALHAHAAPERDLS